MGPQPRSKKTEVREDDMRVEVHLYPGEESSFTVIEHADGGEEKMEFGDPEPDDDEDDKPAEAGEAAAPSEGADEQAPVESDAVEGDETWEEADGLEEEEPSAELPPLPGMPSVEGDDCSDEGVEDEKPAEDGEKSE